LVTIPVHIKTVHWLFSAIPNYELESLGL